MPSKVFFITWSFVVVFLLVVGAPLSVAIVSGAVPAALAAGACKWALRRHTAGGTSGASGASSVSGKRWGTAPLTVTPQPDGWTLIDACPPPLPLLFSFLPAIVGLIVALMVMNLAGPWHDPVFMLGSAFVAGVATGGLLAAWIHGVQNGRRGVQAAAFAVSERAVRVPSGVEIPADRIYALTLRNGIDGHVSFMVTNSTIAAASAMGAAHAAAKLARMAYRVDLDHDGRSTTLAGGLTEPQARAVAAEVSAVYRAWTDSTRSPMS